jgi:hypothetical protein
VVLSVVVQEVAAAAAWTLATLKRQVALVVSILP